MGLHNQHPAPVALSDDVTITDAFVDLCGASAGELYLKTDTTLSYESALPVEADEDGALWLAENDAGVFWAFHDGPVSPPADEPDKSVTQPVTHERLGTEDRVIHYTHVTKREQNSREPRSCLDVGVDPDNGYRTSYPMRIELAQEIIDRYVNGPLGSDTTSYWYHKHTTPRRGNVNLDKYEGYIDCDVVAYYDDIYTWKFKRVEDVTDDNELYV
jgi:hypothetical protein